MMTRIAKEHVSYYSWLSAAVATSDVAESSQCSLARHSQNTKALQPLDHPFPFSHPDRQQLRSSQRLLSPVLCHFELMDMLLLQPVVSVACSRTLTLAT